MWETEAGQQWLHLLVLETIIVFTVQEGIGCERLSQFFHLLRLQRHIGVSLTALRSLRDQRLSKIIDYQQQLLGLKVKYLVSNRAQAIVILALNDLGTVTRS